MNSRDYFYLELEKIAGWGTAVRRGLEHIGGPGRAAMLGGAMGAATGASTAEPGSRFSGALNGAVGGAALGAGAGFVGRRALNAKLLRPELSAGQAAMEGLRESGRSIQRFAKREAHGLTGAYSKTSPTELGYMTPENLEKAKHLENLRANFRSQGASPRMARRAQSEARDAIEGYGQEAREFADRRAHGITSLPGTLHGLATKPRDTSKALYRAATGGSMIGKVGLIAPVAMSIPELARGDERDQGGLSVGQKLLATGGNIAGNLLTAGMPAMSQVVAGGAMDLAIARRANARRIAPAASASAVDSAEGTP